MMKRVHLVLLALALMGVAVASLGAPPVEMRKQLAGPPSEFNDFTFPTPTGSAAPSDTALFPVTFQKVAGSAGLSWTETFPVDSSERLVVGVVSKNAHSLTPSFTSPKAPALSASLPINFTATPTQRINDHFGVSSTSENLLPTSWFVFDKPIVGEWSVTLKNTYFAVGDATDGPSAYLVVYNESPYRLHSYQNTEDLEQGMDVGFQVMLFDQGEVARSHCGKPKPLASSLSGEMKVVFPNGMEHTFNLKDDGLSNDEAANDGIYGALFEATQVGSYFAQTSLEGINPEGRAFLRTTQHTFTVVEPAIALTGFASATYDASSKVVVFLIDVDVNEQSSYAQDEENGFSMTAYTQVWGTDSTGLEYVPVAWLESLVDPVKTDQGYRVSLQMSETWLSIAKATAPFQLRSTRLVEPRTNVPFSTRTAIFVKADQSISSLEVDFSLDPDQIEITEQMKKGPRPPHLLPSDAATQTTVLVHGYCANANEWPLDQFTNAVQFKDFGQSRSNYEFALELYNFIGQYEAVNFVGHSQAGPAAAELLKSFWSPTDVSKRGRLIQTMGSPFMGSGLSSWGSLGKIIGIGCGVNTDLTYDGAARWASSVPQDVRKEVYSYITQYGSKDYCVYGASLFLYSPNDGTTEVKKAFLEGTNTNPAITGWCHTTEMSYPNQCTNAEQNKIFSRYAQQA